MGGRFEDSFAIGDLPTNDELGLLEEEEEDDTETDLRRPSRRKQQQQQRAAKQQQQSPPESANTGDVVVEGIGQGDAVSTHGRWVVVLVLCLSAAGMAFTTFSYIAKTERDEFEATVSCIYCATAASVNRVHVFLYLLDACLTFFACVVSHSHILSNHRLDPLVENWYTPPSNKCNKRFPSCAVRPHRARRLSRP